jgi:hypothetical protein
VIGITGKPQIYRIETTRDKQLTVTIPTSTKNKLIRKILVILISSGLLGYWYSIDTAAQFQKGKQLTLEQYTANFEQHKAKLMSNDYTCAWGHFCHVDYLGNIFWTL